MQKVATAAYSIVRNAGNVPSQTQALYCLSIGKIRIEKTNAPATAEQPNAIATTRPTNLRANIHFEVKAEALYER